MVLNKQPRSEHNLVRFERCYRRAAFKKLDEHDLAVVKNQIAILSSQGLTRLEAFDLIAALGEFLAKERKK